MSEYLYRPFIRDSRLRNELRGILSISIAVFLFILFFDPFPAAKQFKPENSLIYTIGYGGIILFVHFAFLILLQRSKQGKYKSNRYDKGPADLINILIWVCNTTTFVFYLRFVGMVPITFLITFKIAIITIFPVIALKVNYRLKSLQKENKQLKQQLVNQQQLNEKEATINDLIEFRTENNNEIVRITADNILLIKSAENYIELFWHEKGDLKKHMIRATLKSVEEQLSVYKNFERCHRTSIVNVDAVEKSWIQQGKHLIKLRFIDQEITVSRQYVLKFKMLFKGPEEKVV
jgi:DNA-binding LytR/AlgR family response regulator